MVSPAIEGSNPTKSPIARLADARLSPLNNFRRKIT